MAYLGNTPTTQGFIPAIDYFNGNGATVAFTLSRPVASVAQVQATIENVPQNPGDAFTVSGNTITFTSAPPSGTNNIYVYYTSPITQVIQPGQGTVGTAQFASGVTINFADGSASAPSITNDGDTNTGIFFPAADTIAFSEGSSEAMRIDSTGNVGIGTSSPTAKTTISSSVGSVATGQLLIKDPSYAGVGLAQGSSGEGYLYNIANSYLTFGTNNTERMRINSSGNLLVGTTSSLTGTNDQLLQVSSAIATRGYQGLAGISATTYSNVFNFNWTGNAQLWVDSTNIGNIAFTSDYRVKRNVETQTAPALERVMALRPVTYQMADYGTLFKASEEVKEGFIAHEVQEVIPSGAEGVKDDENQIQSLRVDAILAVAVKAIQEQQAIITDLKARIEVLENK
jgi:hypothetical protein